MSPSSDRSTIEQQSPNMKQQPIPISRKLSIEEPVDTRKKSVDQSPRSMNHRKSSYASVREESEFPQSFRTRRPSRDSVDLPADFLPRRLESARIEDEEAVLDDSGSDLTPTESYGSTYTDGTSEEGLKEHPTTIEDLPDEILDQIFDKIQLDVSSHDNYLRPQADLFSSLLVSKAVHNAALRVLYKNVLIYRSKTFHKLVTTLEEDPLLGRLIQTLDFSHYSNMGYGRSRGQTSGTPYLTKENLKVVLGNTSGLKAFLVHEHLDDELDQGVLSSLFSIPTLRAVDFTSCSSGLFVDAFTKVWANAHSAQYTQIRRLCLHECTTLKPGVFEAILPRLGQLTHLDLAHTQVNDTALLSIPATARLTHLNLERCTQITGSAVVRFLTQHPAASDSMVWLSLNADASRYRLLSAEDLDTLLPALPFSLRALNIGGSRITSQHVPALRLLATHLEELGLKGAKLSLSGDITQILSLPPDRNTKLEKPHLKTSLRYIDLTDITSVTQMSLSYSPISIKDTHSLPLEVIELGGPVLTEIARRNKNVKNPDWTVKELGRRGWYVRTPEGFPSNTQPDDGHRAWKMGARWWGMRKLPMVEQEVGGVYGYFMFKRN
ncbi:hypothetical protein PMZ80_003566 [Knufia obscura]|nr:hypothetical protein PMZ80_003566 [Knufia obscura]